MVPPSASKELGPSHISGFARFRTAKMSACTSPIMHRFASYHRKLCMDGEHYQNGEHKQNCSVLHYNYCIIITSPSSYSDSGPLVDFSRGIVHSHLKTSLSQNLSLHSHLSLPQAISWNYDHSFDSHCRR